MINAKDIEKMCSYATFRTGKQESLHDSTCLCGHSEVDRVYCVGIGFFDTGHKTMDVSYHMDRVEKCPYRKPMDLQEQKKVNPLIDCLD